MSKDELNELVETFQEKHGDTFNSLKNSVKRAVEEHDGDSLLLLRQMCMEAVTTITAIIGAGGPKGENN